MDPMDAYALWVGGGTFIAAICVWRWSRNGR